MSQLNTNAASTPSASALSELLTELNRILMPRTYLEVGLGDGAALCHFTGEPIDLAVIDGSSSDTNLLHDFISLEKNSTPSTVIVIDSFKLAPVLQQYRPDLFVIPLNAGAQGVILVLGLDKTNTVLADNYTKIAQQLSHIQTQTLAEFGLSKTNAFDVTEVLSSPIWEQVVGDRPSGKTSAEYQPLWAQFRRDHPGLEPIGTIGPDTLIKKGDIIKSPNGKYELEFAYGELALSHEGIITHSTGAVGASTVVLQGDGNFVVYRGEEPLLASNTDELGHNLAVLNNGTVVIRSWLKTPVRILTGKARDGAMLPALE